MNNVKRIFDDEYLKKKKKQKKHTQTHSDSTKKLSETDIINMLVFLINNILVIFGGRVFQQTLVQTVLLFWLTCSFIRMSQTLYTGFSRNTKRN